MGKPPKIRLSTHERGLLEDVEFFRSKKIITEKIAGLPMSMIEDIAATQLNATMRNFKIAGAATGFAIGLIQIAFTFWSGAH